MYTICWMLSFFWARASFHISHFKLPSLSLVLAIEIELRQIQCQYIFQILFTLKTNIQPQRRLHIFFNTSFFGIQFIMLYDSEQGKSAIYTNTSENLQARSKRKAHYFFLCVPYMECFVNLQGLTNSADCFYVNICIHSFTEYTHLQYSMYRCTVYTYENIHPSNQKRNFLSAASLSKQRK